MIRVLRAGDRIAVPWKNGGGITREIAVWPPDAGFNDFDWRVSVAEVREAGPFSRFNNIDRTLMILEGWLVLAFSDRLVELTTNSEPFAFRGDMPCDGQPVEGPVTDLNVMTRRGRATAIVRRVTNESTSAGARHSLIVAIAACAITVDGESALLAPRDAIHIEGAAGDIRITGTAYAMTFA